NGSGVKPLPGIVRLKDAEGHYRRLPEPMLARFGRAMDDTLQDLERQPLDRRVIADRLAIASRVVLMIWLLTDPDADAFRAEVDRPYLTEFQNWRWNRNWAAIEGDWRVKPV